MRDDPLEHRLQELRFQDPLLHRLVDLRGKMSAEDLMVMGFVQLTESNLRMQEVAMTISRNSPAPSFIVPKDRVQIIQQGVPGEVMFVLTLLAIAGWALFFFNL
jgi:hypothetical protein